MTKNSQIHIYLETELVNNIRKQAKDCNMRISKFCQLKLIGDSQLIKIESLIKELDKKLNTQLNLMREVKNGNKIAGIQRIHS